MKLLKANGIDIESYVAPYAGAWIETEVEVSPDELTLVAPYAGAWIETPLTDTCQTCNQSLLTQERGLKHIDYTCNNINPVAPYAGAWIETPLLSSLSTRGRVVAPYAGAWIETIAVKSPSRRSIVAPYAGAWIETPLLFFDFTLHQSLLTQERGLKP